ncbi:MAG: hypothetical protein ACSLE3_07180 [Microbacteriaceae bacterium]
MPTDRVYVFFPEEPFSFINLPSGLRHFHDGRLLSDVDKLSADDLRHLGAQRTASGQQKFLFCEGDPRKAVHLHAPLQQRFARVAAFKATASSALKTMDDAMFMYLSAIAVTGDQPAYQAFDGGNATALKTIARLLPTAMEDINAKTQLQSYEDQQRDADVIAQAAAGNVDDTPRPDTDDDLPASFSPPPEDPFAKKE